MTLILSVSPLLSLPTSLPSLPILCGSTRSTLHIHPLHLPFPLPYSPSPPNTAMDLLLLHALPFPLLYLLYPLTLPTHSTLSYSPYPSPTSTHPILTHPTLPRHLRTLPLHSPLLTCTSKLFYFITSSLDSS